MKKIINYISCRRNAHVCCFCSFTDLDRTDKVGDKEIFALLLLWNRHLIRNLL